MSNSAKKRLDYLDVSKVLAIYLVTFAHCAQVLCGEKFPTLLVSKDSFISVNMAIFMIASGFVMNLDKMKATPLKDYILQKAFRLLLPMTTWYAVMCVVTRSVPNAPTYWSLYWYLGAMFVCLSLIKLLTTVTSSTFLVCVLSVLILTLMPMISFERSCYMMPFLWVGYGLRHIIDRINIFPIVFLLIIYAVLYYFWDINYSIYVSPFHIWNADAHAILALLFRFAIGTIGGVGIICLLRMLISHRAFAWLKSVAKYGPYTLGVYTMSFVLNAILVRVLWHTNWFISKPGWLDLASLVVTTLMMILMYWIQKMLEKNKISGALFLGLFQVDSVPTKEGRNARRDGQGE